MTHGIIWALELLCYLLKHDKVNSVCRCVIPYAFWVKVSNIHFLVERRLLFKKKDVSIFLAVLAS